ncbi:MAG: citrate (Si)-synthase [Verrucomicrobiota bacterium]|nr:citrate (Si)-synthase [Verrucomicrobiota bacterium]
MAKETLFTVTEEHLETGLRGIPVGYCVTSSIDPYKGLSYVGHPIATLATRDPIEVIYLLYTGREGTTEEKARFQEELVKRGRCSEETLESIARLPRKGQAMDMLAAALLVVGMCEGKGDYREDCLDLIAKMPQIVATVINHHAGWGKTSVSKPELGYIENFVQMLALPGGGSSDLLEIMRLFNILHYDHAGGNLSVFVGKAVASGLEQMYGAMAAAMTALAGPRHGRATQDCLEFVQEVLREVGPSATAQAVNRLVRKRLEEGKLLFGFGHAVLRAEDSRATILYDYCKEHFADNPLVSIALLLRSEGSQILQENPKITNPHPNVDAISGTLLSAAGFPYPDYFPLLFGLSRSVGIAIQIVYERLEARSGKGTPIVRPRYVYKPRIIPHPTRK